MPFFDPSTVALSRDGRGGYTHGERFSVRPKFSDPPGGGAKSWVVTDAHPELTSAFPWVNGQRECFSLGEVRSQILTVLQRPAR